MGDTQIKMTNSKRWPGTPAYIASSTENNTFMEKSNRKKESSFGFPVSEIKASH